MSTTRIDPCGCDCGRNYCHCKHACDWCRGSRAIWIGRLLGSTFDPAEDVTEG